MFLLHHPTDRNEAVQLTQPTISKVLSNKRDIMSGGMTIQARVAQLDV
jgi:hypothetical protein